MPKPINDIQEELNSLASDIPLFIQTGIPKNVKSERHRSLEERTQSLLQDLLDHISDFHETGLNVIIGYDNPNETSPGQPYGIGQFFLQKDFDTKANIALWIFTGVNSIGWWQLQNFEAETAKKFYGTVPSPNSELIEFEDVKIGDYYVQTDTGDSSGSVLSVWIYLQFAVGNQWVNFVETGNYAELDETGHLKKSQTPPFLRSQLLYGGTFNASTGVATLSDRAKEKLNFENNTITLANTDTIYGAAANEGIYYICATTGTLFGVKYEVDDWILSNGLVWIKSNNAGAVKTVMGVEPGGNGDVDISGKSIDWTHATQKMSNLPDKSADATFTHFVGKDSAGQLARVGYQAFKNQAENWTQPQKDEFTQILNGGFSTRSMSVNLISPPIFEWVDEPVYVRLRGAGLNLHPTERKIEILDYDTLTVLAEVPNGQIAIADPTEILFYCNFHSLGVGIYKIKITNGAATYVTTLNMEIVSSVENIDLKGNTFNIITSYVNTLSWANNNTVSFENEIAGETQTTPIFSAKSDELFEQGTDWYLELQVESTKTGVNGSQIDTRIGIGYSDVANQLIFSSLNYMIIRTRNNAAQIMSGVKGGSVNSAGEVLSDTVVFVKQGNILTVVHRGETNIETISNNSGYSLFFQTPNRIPTEITSIQIIKAYKF